jgi:hypothetical protein
MSRLPQPGGDDNQWGQVLNDFLTNNLNGEHNLDGTQKTLSVNKGGTGATTTSAARTNLGLVSTATKGQANGYAPLESTGKVLATYLPNTGSTAPPTGPAGGDLGGNYPNPTIPALANKVDTTDARLSDARTPLGHQASHQAGGSDAIGGLLDASARVQIQVAGVGKGTRRGLNLVTNATGTSFGNDDSANEQTTVQVVTPAASPKWFNVKDYGANGIYGQDNTAGVQAACAAARASTSGVAVVYFPAGIYMINAPINAYNVHLKGDGRSTSMILASTDWAASINGSWVIDQQPSLDGVGVTAANAGRIGPTPLPGTGIEGLWITGPFGSQPVGQVTAKLSGVRVGSGCSLTDVRIDGFFAGAFVTGSDEKFLGCNIGGNYYGIYFGTPCATRGGQIIQEMNLDGATWAGIGIAPGTWMERCKLRRIHFGATGFGIYKDSDTPNDKLMVDCTLMNVPFESAPNGMIFVNGPAGVGADVTGNTFMNTAGYNCMQPGQNLATSVLDSRGYAIGRFEAPIDIGAGAWTNNTGDVTSGTCVYPPSTNYTSFYRCGSYSGNSGSNDGPLWRIDQDGKEFIKGPTAVDGTFKSRFLFCRMFMNTTNGVINGDVMEAAGGANPAIARCTTGRPVGINTYGCNAGQVATIVTRGILAVNCGSNSITANSYVKPDPSQPGCVVTATAGDANIIGVAQVGNSNGKATIWLRNL